MSAGARFGVVPRVRGWHEQTRRFSLRRSGGYERSVGYLVARFLGLRHTAGHARGVRKARMCNEWRCQKQQAQPERYPDREGNELGHGLFWYRLDCLERHFLRELRQIEYIIQRQPPICKPPPVPQTCRDANRGALIQNGRHTSETPAVMSASKRRMDAHSQPPTIILRRIAAVRDQVLCRRLQFQARHHAVTVGQLH